MKHPSRRPARFAVHAAVVAVIFTALAGLFHVIAGAQDRPKPPKKKRDFFSRTQPDRLDAVHAGIEQLQKARRPVQLSHGLNDYKGIFHCHSVLSGDSPGTRDDIVAGAKAAGVKVIFMTEHVSQQRDTIAEGISGMVEGILFIPGQERSGLLVFPAERRQPSGGSTEQIINEIVGAGGLAFLSHPEGIADWNLKGATGVEIYNSHADANDNPEIFAAWVDEKRLKALADAFEKYPQETFAGIIDRPAAFLHKWDRTFAQTPLVGVAANDCHYNSGARLKLSVKGDLLVEDYSGHQVARCKPETLNIRVPEDAKPGDTLASIPVDTYERSFKCVSTHILAAEINEKSIRDAVKAGRCYVCFDWLGDPAGFVFMGRAKERQLLPGDSAGLADAPMILAESPLPAEFHLYRNGTRVLIAEGYGFEYEALAPGNYRLEVFLSVADEKLPWIFTNQIRIGE